MNQIKFAKPNNEVCLISLSEFRELIWLSREKNLTLDIRDDLVCFKFSHNVDEGLLELQKVRDWVDSKGINTRPIIKSSWW